MATSNFDNGVLLFIVRCWMFIILQLTCFLPFTFPDSALYQLQWLSQQLQSPVPLQFPHLDLLLLHTSLPLIMPSIFRVCGYLCPWVASAQALYVGFILPYMSFKPLPWCCVEWSFGYLVRWLPCSYLIVLQIYVIKVVQDHFFFPDLPAAYSIWSTSMVLLLIPTYIPTHLNVEADYLSCGKLVPQWHVFPHIPKAAFQLLGQPEVDVLAFLCTNQGYFDFTVEWPLSPGALGLNAFNHLWKFQACYIFPPSALIPLVLSSF